VQVPCRIASDRWIFLFHLYLYFRRFVVEISPIFFDHVDLFCRWCQLLYTLLAVAVQIFFAIVILMCLHSFVTSFLLLATVPVCGGFQMSCLCRGSRLNHWKREAVLIRSCCRLFCPAWSRPLCLILLRASRFCFLRKRVVIPRKDCHRVCPTVFVNLLSCTVVAFSFPCGFDCLRSSCDRSLHVSEHAPGQTQIWDSVHWRLSRFSWCTIAQELNLVLFSAAQTQCSSLLP